MPRRFHTRASLALALAASFLAAPVALPAQGPLAVAHEAGAAAPACPAGPLALVLPGGGVRGMAHVGVIQVLDSLGVVPDMIVGTSMGAIVGALYASGYTGDEIERLTRRYDLGAYVGRYAPRAPRSLGPQPPLLLWEEGEGGDMDLETAAAQEGRINALLSALMLRGNLQARGDFDSLPVRFRAVATDLRTGERVALGKGDLAQAVRASFAIPLVFDPVPIDGRTLVDGGLAENVPVRLARDLGATRVVLSGLSLAEITGVPTTPEIAQRVLDLLFDQTYPPLRADDVAMESQVDDATNLDFRDSTMRVMIGRGREAAGKAFTELAARDPGALACLTTRVASDTSRVSTAARARRAAPTLAQPLLARGANGRARHFVEKTLGAREGGTLGFDTLQARLARLGDVEAIRGAWLHPVAAGDGGDAVALRPEVRLAPRRAIGAGLAFDNDLGGRAWAGVVDRRLAGKPLEAAVRGIAGQWRQDVALELRKGVEDVRDARSPFVRVAVSREDVRLFDDRGVELPQTTLPRVEEGLAVVGLDMPRGDRLELQATALVRRWTNAREGAPLPADDVQEEGTAWGIGLRLRAGDSDMSNAPGTAARAMTFEGEWTPRYARGLLTAGQRLGSGRWQAYGTMRLAMAGRETPLTGWTTLGGSDGFAGLRLGERIGRAEASAMLDVSRGLLGPVRAHLTMTGGQMSPDPARPLDGDWLAGARVGFGAETPIGPVRAQYGINGTRRSQWFLRVGRWF